jgi:hypothetical protein
MVDCTFSWIRGRRTTSRQVSWTDSVSAEVDTESDQIDQAKKRRHRVSQAQLTLGRAFLTLPTQCHQSLTHANTVCHSHKWAERREMVVSHLSVPMQSLEVASVHQNIKPFTDFLATLVKDNIEGKPGQGSLLSDVCYRIGPVGCEIVFKPLLGARKLPRQRQKDRYCDFPQIRHVINFPGKSTYPFCISAIFSF